MGQCLTSDRLQREFEVSAATIKRDIAHLRYLMNAPIVHEQGRWLLELPYADPRELAMDILRHVP